MASPQPGQIAVPKATPIRLLVYLSSPRQIWVKVNDELIFDGESSPQDIHLTIDRWGGGLSLEIRRLGGWSGGVVVVECGVEGSRLGAVYRFFTDEASTSARWTSLDHMGISPSAYRSLPEGWSAERVFGAGGGFVVFREPEVAIDLGRGRPIPIPLPRGIFADGHDIPMAFARWPGGFVLVIATRHMGIVWITNSSVRSSAIIADDVSIDRFHVHAVSQRASYHRHITNTPLASERDAEGWDVHKWPFPGRASFMGQSVAWWDESKLLTTDNFHPIYGADSAVRWDKDLLELKDGFKQVQVISSGIVRVNDSKLLDIESIKVIR